MAQQIEKRGRLYSVSFSGTGTTGRKLRDGKMNVLYCRVLSKADADRGFKVNNSYPLLGGKVSYGTFFPSYDMGNGRLDPMVLDYSTDIPLGVTPAEGLYEGSVSTDIISYSIYRREYNIYQKPGTRITGYYIDGNFYYNIPGTSADSLPITPHDGYIYVDTPTQYTYQYDRKGERYVLVNTFREYKGEWKPVAINVGSGNLRDYNVTNGRSYQYVMYPNTTSTTGGSGPIPQVFANSDGMVFVPDANISGQGKVVEGTPNTSHLYGSPVRTGWGEWSIVELEPITDGSIAKLPMVRKAYRANPDQLWLFRFSLETGSQTQNISRTDFQTLGQYPRMGFGKSDYASGDVTALLGSEIIPYSSKSRYIERLGKARVEPLSTNEKTEMLKQWRKLVSSRNPKLLKDIKGQSWIVQITGSNNKPQNFYAGQPDTISFQWKEVSGTDNIIIYGDGGRQPSETREGTEPWESVFR